nr:hypothetical protein [Tanacetum cinerariifolium]
CDNRGEFRNKEMNDFCSRKGIRREFSNARIPQQNGVAERRNRTLIEAARTMLADAKVPITFWAEAVNTLAMSKIGTKVPKGSGNPNPTASTSNPPADQMESLIVETPIPIFCLFSCFLSQVEAKKIFEALQDPSWVEAMQEELLQFKIQNVWTLVDCPKGVRPIGTKWVLKNKKDERGIVIRNNARLVAQGHIQEEGINYDEMDAESAFLYGTIDEEVYVM